MVCVLIHIGICHCCVCGSSRCALNVGTSQVHKNEFVLLEFDVTNGSCVYVLELEEALQLRRNVRFACSSGVGMNAPPTYYITCLAHRVL